MPPDFTKPIILWQGEPHEMVFLPIPAGRFRMGSRGGSNSEEPRHLVEITRPFWMAETPVTQVQYRYMAGQCLADLAKIEGNEGAEPSRFKGKDTHPVENVSWDDARAIGAWLTASGKLPDWLPDEFVTQLPTAAQWEYTCRAETDTEYYTGDGEAALDQAGWYGGNSGDSTRPVKGREPNEFRLHDMHGNVWEWCSDSWDEGAYGKRGFETVDPFVAGNADSQRVLRGGSWFITAGSCRSAFRIWNPPHFRVGIIGFRLCLSSGPVENSQPERGAQEKKAELSREREGGTTDQASGGGAADWSKGSSLPDIPSA